MSTGDQPHAGIPAGPSAASAEGSAVPAPQADLPPRRRHWLKVVATGLVSVGIVLGSIVASLLYFNVESLPVVGRFVRDRLVAELQARIDPQLRLSIDDVDIQRSGDETTVRISDVRVRDASGRSLFHAPVGKVRIATAPLLALKLVPNQIALDGLHADVMVLDNGELALSEGGDASAEPAPAGQPATPEQAMVALDRMIGGVFGGIAGVRQAVGGRLPDVSVSNAILTIRDMRSGRTQQISGIGSDIQTDADGASIAKLRLHAGAPVAVTVRLSPPGERQTLTVETEDVALKPLLQAMGLHSAALDEKSRLTISVAAEVAADMRPRTASATIATGDLLLHLDQKIPPVPVKKAVARLDWSSGQEHIAITDFAAESEGSVIRLSGSLTPPAAGSEGWGIRLADAGTVLEPLGKGDPQIRFDALQAALTALPQSRVLSLDALEARVGAASAHVTARLAVDEQHRPGITVAAKIANVEGRTALRLWPGFAATGVRQWLIGHIQKGHLNTLDLKVDMPPTVLDDAAADRPVPAEAVAVAFTASHVAMVPAPGLPLVQNLSGSGTSSGRTASIDLQPGAFIDAGQGRRLTLSDGLFTISDFARKPADARLKMKLSGPVEGALEVIKAPGLQAHLPKGIDTLKARGLIDADLNVALRLSPKIDPADVRANVAAQLRNLNIDKGIGDEKIEAGVFTLTADKESFLLKGDARLFGTPAAIEVKGAGKAPAVANVSMTIDDAVRARKGIQLGPGVTGPVGLKVSVKLDGDNDAVIDADLTRLAIPAIVPGVAKKAGASGRLRGKLSELDNGGWMLDQMELDAAPVSARGSVQIGKDGGFVKAQLSSLRLAQGDAMQVEAERVGGVMRLILRANSVDARPYLKSVLTGGIDKSGGKDVDIALKSTILSGFNGEIVANADLKMTMRGGGLQAFALTGRFDGGGVSARLQPGGGKNGTLAITSEDAGAFLRFFDVYTRMRGGKLELNAFLGNGTQNGGLVVRGFVLRDEPAMRKLVASAETQAESTDSARLSHAPQSARGRQDVPFTRMSVQFVRTPGRLTLRDGVLIGPEIGGNIEGTLDHARDVADLSGTFVPAYSLNNALASVPLVGPIITGGKSEGLFAVRYHISGRASSPTLQVNPLTAIAPGFLRRLIDFRRSSE